MAFQRNRYGIEQDFIEVAEKDLADKVGTFNLAYSWLLPWEIVEQVIMSHFVSGYQ